MKCIRDELQGVIDDNTLPDVGDSTSHEIMEKTYAAVYAAVDDAVWEAVKLEVAKPPMTYPTSA